MPDIEGTGFTRRIVRLTGPRAIAATPGTSRKVFAPTFETEFKLASPMALEGGPGLRLCLSDEHDLDVWVNEMVMARLYSEGWARDCASRWIKNPLKWAIKTTWRGKIIQLEAFHFFMRLKPVLWGGLAVHVDRARPHWFWKVISRPVLCSIYNHGFRTIKTHVRLNAPVYAKFLQSAYGYELIKETDRGFLMSMEIGDAIGRIQDWPKRRTLGPDWTWAKDEVLVREATEKDFPLIYQKINESWGDNPRKETAIHIFEDRWTLDMAAVILAFYKGDLIDVRTYRERTDPAENVVSFPLRMAINYKDSLGATWPAYEAAGDGFLTWQGEAGYKDSSIFLETRLIDRLPLSYRERAVSYGDKNGFTEFKYNVEGRLNARKQVAH